MTSPTNPSTSVRQCRKALDSSCKYVGREEFLDLILSNRQMVRFDEPQACLRGLSDVQTGERFVIEEEKLIGWASEGI